MVTGTAKVTECRIFSRPFLGSHIINGGEISVGKISPPELPTHQLLSNLRWLSEKFWWTDMELLISEARPRPTTRACTLPSTSKLLLLAVQQESCNSVDDLSCYAIAFLQYVHAINTWQLKKYQAVDCLQNLLHYDGSWDAYLKFRNGGSGDRSWSKASRWKQPQWLFRLSYNTSNRFLSLVKPCFLPVYRLACLSIVPDGSWVHCGKVLKVTWSGELSGKCAAIDYV